MDSESGRHHGPRAAGGFRQLFPGWRHVAMSADWPVTGFAVKTSVGEPEPAGEVFGAGLYGWPVRVGSDLAESLRLALEQVMSTGEYRTIATMWGVQRGMVDAPTVNGAGR